jgi:quercetin dioxygenase-like cupin family protein
MEWVNADAGPSSYGEYPAVETDRLSARTIVVPPCHFGIPVAGESENIYVGIEGSIEVVLEGDEVFTIGPRDVLRLCSGTPHYLSNSAFSHSLVGRFSALLPQKPTGEFPKVELLKWDEYKRAIAWNLPLADQWGMHRGQAPYLISEVVKGHTVLQPPGQSTPWHLTSRDLIFVGLSGSVEFAAAGQVWALGAADLFMLPGNIPYRYSNHALETAVFFDIGSVYGTDMDPPTRVYFQRDPGWPVDLDTPELETEFSVSRSK